MKFHQPSSASVALEEGGPKKAQYEERSDDVLGEIAQTPRPSRRLAFLRPGARGRIWPPRNSLNCGLRSTWSRCHTNRSTAILLNQSTQLCVALLRIRSWNWAIIGPPRCG
jgi:hypothetical protein